MQPVELLFFFILPLSLFTGAKSGLTWAIYETCVSGSFWKPSFSCLLVLALLPFSKDF
jgi:hypothetical protein